MPARAQAAHINALSVLECVEANPPQYSTPLLRAALKGRTENVRLLLEHGADVEAKDPVSRKR